MTDIDQDKVEEQLSKALDKVLEGIDEFNDAANKLIKANVYSGTFVTDLNRRRIKFTKLQTKLIMFKDEHAL
jgi:hypothetical protein